MMVRPKVKGIPAFPAGNRPGRLRKRRTRQRDERREQWLTRHAYPEMLEQYQ